MSAFIDANGVLHDPEAASMVRVIEREFLIVVLNVDDPNGAALAEALMPGHDWAPIRERGEISYARGMADHRAIQDLLEGTSKTSHPHRDAASETTPWHIWHSAVIEIASVSLADANRYATRERIERAYSAGEPAWMAADMVQQFVTVGKREDRADHEVDGLRRAIRASVLR